MPENPKRNRRKRREIEDKENSISVESSAMPRKKALKADQCLMSAEFSRSDIKLIQKFLLARLDEKTHHLKTQQNFEHSTCLKHANSTLCQLFESCLYQNESNSVLVLGPRGSGKSLVVEAVLEEYQSKFLESSSHGFCTVYLNGSIHTDDKEVLREMALAFQKFSRKSTERSNNKDSIPNDIAKIDSSFSATLKQFGTSFSECFLRLFQHLKNLKSDISSHKAGQRKSRSNKKEISAASLDRSVPIVFILDEFDMFASHPKQSLLYNLFDTVQHQKVSSSSMKDGILDSSNPMLVIGLTVRQDAMDLLEKRVKSRFSHRSLYLWPPESFDSYNCILRDTLKLDRDSSDLSALSDSKLSLFNRHIDDLFENSTCCKVFKRLYDLEGSIRQAYKVLMLALANISPECFYLKPDWIFDAFYSQFADSKTLQLKDLSFLEISLVSSTKRLIDKQVDRFNFEMVYSELHEFAVLNQMNYKKAVVYKAFENLIGLELIRPLDSISKCPKEFRMCKLLLEPIQVKEAVMRSSDLPYSIKRWVSEQ